MRITAALLAASASFPYMRSFFNDGFIFSFVLKRERKREREREIDFVDCFLYAKPASKQASTSFLP